MIQGEYVKVRLWFKETAITSRASMQYKDTYIVAVRDTEATQLCGVGECALFSGLSEEDSPFYEQFLKQSCINPLDVPPISSLRFGFESALRDLRNGGTQNIFSSPFTSGDSHMTINGLIWMGDKRQMKQRIATKLKDGFTCIKLKIGGIDFEEELELLKDIRDEFSSDEVELRLDANGAFSIENALNKLHKLAKFTIHSIEQPIKPGQWKAMSDICEKTPIPIALDEDLIGFIPAERKRLLLDTIKPQFIILKPSLCGGFREADEWILEAEHRKIGWWATSALESNIGLNAIAQWVGQYTPKMPQGLGTGSLYTDNFPCHIQLCGEKLSFNPVPVSSEAVWQKAIEVSRL